MPVRYVIVFQRYEGENPPFPSKIIKDFRTQWSTFHGIFRKAVCSAETFNSKKAAVEASKNYKKALEEGKSSIRYERPRDRENPSSS